MSKILQIKMSIWMTPLLVVCAMCVGMKSATASHAGANSAASLRAKYAELKKLLSNNQFNRPLYLHSVETSDHIKGDIYALVNYPFVTVNRAINNPAHWCDILILHLNTKYCSATKNKNSSSIAVSVGKKIYQPLDEAYRLEFIYKIASATREYFDIQLNAKTGPLGTSDYRIRLEAVSVKSRKTFLHLSYSYAYDYVARLAMESYLTTIGADKVGFTHVGDPSADPPDYIRGVRGVVERNTMRYYLAIDAYLGALSVSPDKQFERRLHRWFTATEQYPRQLHEVDRATYIDMKRREYLRQQTSPSNGAFWYDPAEASAP